MKTAIIKTTFWDDEEFETLNIDSKILYFYLLANPTRTLHKIIKLNDKVCSAHTGLSTDQIKIAKIGLIEKKLVVFKDRYYILLKDYVEAKKGRFTQNVIDREDKEIPKDIKDFLENYTGIIPVHKDNNKDKDNNKYNNKDKEKKTETKSVDLIAEVIFEMTKLDPKNRMYYGNKTQRAATEFLISTYGFENVINMIRAIPELKLKISYMPSITTPCELRDKWQKVGDAIGRERVKNNNQEQVLW